MDLQNFEAKDIDLDVDKLSLAYTASLVGDAAFKEKLEKVTFKNVEGAGTAPRIQLMGKNGIQIEE